MIQLREISVEEAMDMIRKGEMEKLYMKFEDGSIDCVRKYNVGFSEIMNKKYFKKETQ